MIVHACTSSHSSGGEAIRNQHPEDVHELVTSTDFVWHQRFELEDGVYTPGVHDIEWLMDAAGVPRDLSRRAVLDVGTSNGGAAFVAERRGAERVVALDIYPPAWFGFDRLARFLDSRAEYVQATVYELPRLVEGRFDDIIFLGVLYHLRHPLLALDALRAVARGAATSTSKRPWRTPSSHSKAQPAWCVSTALTSSEMTRATGSPRPLRR
jgi:SAM-dependent methyltransferase